jgi:hypothetical protein
MIKMEQPSLALHSHNVPGYKYKMWATYTTPKTLPISTLVSWIEWAIDHSPDDNLSNVIINCHGSPGYLHIATGIGVHDLEPFKRLRQKQSIGRIWIVACEVHKTTSKLGSDFCTALARAAAVSVVAADALQYVNESSLPDGYIDDYEGNVYAYDGSGSKSLSKIPITNEIA